MQPFDAENDSDSASMPSTSDFSLIEENPNEQQPASPGSLSSPSSEALAWGDGKAAVERETFRNTYVAQLNQMLDTLNGVFDLEDRDEFQGMQESFLEQLNEAVDALGLNADLEEIIQALRDQVGSLQMKLAEERTTTRTLRGTLQSFYDKSGLELADCQERHRSKQAALKMQLADCEDVRKAGYEMLKAESEAKIAVLERGYNKLKEILDSVRAEADQLHQTMEKKNEGLLQLKSELYRLKLSEATLEAKVSEQQQELQKSQKAHDEVVKSRRMVIQENDALLEENTELSWRLEELEGTLEVFEEEAAIARANLTDGTQGTSVASATKKEAEDSHGSLQGRAEWGDMHLAPPASPQTAQWPQPPIQWPSTLPKKKEERAEPSLWQPATTPLEHQQWGFGIYRRDEFDSALHAPEQTQALQTQHGAAETVPGQWPDLSFPGREDDGEGW